MSNIIEKIADVPLARPGFDSIGLTAPIMMQMNPTGKWESSKPETLDEEKLHKVVKYLVQSNAVNAVQSYCSRCAAENKNAGGSQKSNYVPVIMMPIYSAEDCPFDVQSESKKLETQEPKLKKARATKDAIDDVSKEEKVTKGLKKRVYRLQRLTDFDLLSQW